VNGIVFWFLSQPVYCWYTKATEYCVLILRHSALLKLLIGSRSIGTYHRKYGSFDFFLFTLNSLCFSCLIAWLPIPVLCWIGVETRDILFSSLLRKWFQLPHFIMMFGYRFVIYNLCYAELCTFWFWLIQRFFLIIRRCWILSKGFFLHLLKWTCGFCLVYVYMLYYI
jgi:hypothetical protein